MVLYIHLFIFAKTVSIPSLCLSLFALSVTEAILIIYYV